MVVLVELHFFCSVGLKSLSLSAFYTLVSLHLPILVCIWPVHRIDGINGFGTGDVRSI